MSRAAAKNELVFEVTDGVAVLTLNRPEARNALSPTLYGSLVEAVASLDERDDVSAAVLTGADPAFCAGFDLKRLASEDRKQQRQRQHEKPPFLGMLPAHEVPMVAAVNGPAVTGGLELALACDLIVASSKARFADTHARVGLLPGGGLTVRLPALVGPNRALQMSLTGDFVDGATAAAWGLANEVVAHERLLPRALELARSMATADQSSLRAIRRLYDEVAALRGEEAWRHENVRARRWMAERFDQGRLATERQAIVARGRRQA